MFVTNVGAPIETGEAAGSCIISGTSNQSKAKVYTEIGELSKEVHEVCKVHPSAKIIDIA
jgi:hypothetical protein